MFEHGLIRHFVLGVVTYPYQDWSYSMWMKTATGVTDLMDTIMKGSVHSNRLMYIDMITVCDLVEMFHVV